MIDGHEPDRVKRAKEIFELAQRTLGFHTAEVRLIQEGKLPKKTAREFLEEEKGK